MHPVQMSKNRDGNASLERLRGKKLSQECVPFGERVLAKQISTRPTNRMNSRYKFGIWLGIRSNSAECFTGNADGVLEARKIRRLTPQSRWDKKAIKNVIGVLWRMPDGRWTVDRPEIRVDPIPILPLSFEGALSRRSKSSTNSEFYSDAQVATQSKTTEGREPIHIVQSTN